MRRLIVVMPDAEMRALQKAARIQNKRPGKLFRQSLASLVERGHDRQARLVLHHASMRRAALASAIPAAALETVLNYQEAVMIRSASRVEENRQTYQQQGEPAHHDAERERRLAVLRATAGMWKDRSDLPQDGLQYQIEARAEWD